MAAEAEAVADYQELQRSSPDPVAQELIALLMDDERSHSALLQRMVARLTAEVTGGVAADRAFPIGPGVSPGSPAAVAATRSLIREEREGARHLRHLARQERAHSDEVLAVLLETIARDDEKHEQVLRYLLKRLEMTSR